MSLLEKFDDFGSELFRPVTRAWTRVTGRDSFLLARAALAVGAGIYLPLAVVTLSSVHGAIAVALSPIVYWLLFSYIRGCEEDANAPSGLRGWRRARWEPLAVLFRLVAVTLGTFSLGAVVVDHSMTNMFGFLDHLFHAIALYAAVHNEPGAGQSVFARLRDVLTSPTAAAGTVA